MTQILKVRASLMQNFMELDMKKFSDHKALMFEVQGQKTNLGQILWQRTYQAICPEPLAAIFTNRASFSQESRDEANKIMKSQEIS